ncbi:MAG: cytochrome oxidase subunit III [Flavobacteriales bacterium]|nr:cytochrome oxidase subunit III [Flavobacteriales bacterium]|tara:strand:+ start:6326 stop:7243 length:918 start_codon:yes stop_codon:yes gene_type:complete
MKKKELQTNDTWAGGGKPMKASYGKLMMWFFLITDALTFSAFLGAYGYHRFVHFEEWPIADHVFTHFPFIQGHYPLFYVALMTFILIVSSVTMVLAVHAGKYMNKKGVVIWLFLTIVGGVTFLGSQAWEWYHFIKGTKHGAVLVLSGQHGQPRVAHYVSPESYDYQKKAYNYSKIDPYSKEYLFKFHKEKMEKEPYNYKYLNGDTVPEDLLNDGKVIRGAPLTGPNAFRYNEYGHTTFSNFFYFITGFHGFHVFTGVIINIIIFVNVLNNVYQRRGHYEMVEKVGLYWHFVDLVWVFVFTFFYLV